MIRFNCPACGHGLLAKEAHTGKPSHCPQCNQVIRVPMASSSPPPPTPPTQDIDEKVTFPEGEMRLKDRPPDGPRPEAQPPPWDVPESSAATPMTPKGIRRYPWPLDVLLYPSSGSGLLNLAVFGGLLLLNIVLARVRVNIPFGGILLLIFITSITAYLIYYLAECVRDSADGGTRAPDNLTAMPDFRAAVLQLQDLLLAALAFGVPAGVYGLVQWRIDPVFWAMVGCAVFCFPMALLSVILFDSLSGLNPKYWLVSIIYVFLPYLGLMGMLVMVAGATALTVAVMEWSMAWFLMSAVGTFYLAMMTAHVLGRFYFRYEKKIGWGI